MYGIKSPLFYIPFSPLQYKSGYEYYMVVCAVFKNMPSTFMDTHGCTYVGVFIVSYLEQFMYMDLLLLLSWYLRNVSFPQFYTRKKFEHILGMEQWKLLELLTFSLFPHKKQVPFVSSSFFYRVIYNNNFLECNGSLTWGSFHRNSDFFVNKKYDSSLPN